MTWYVVSYDLRDPQRDYSRLYTRLDAWRALRVLESVLIIRVKQSSSSSIRDDLKKYIDSNDGLFVAKLTAEAAWSSLDCSDQETKNKLSP